MARIRATHAPAALHKTVLKPTSTAIAKKPAYNTHQTQKREINVVIFLRKKIIHERFMQVPLPQFKHILELRAQHRKEFPEPYELSPPPSEHEFDDSRAHWETFKTFSSTPVTSAAPEPEIKHESETEPEIKHECETKTEIKQEVIEFPLRATTADTITQLKRSECVTFVDGMMQAR